MEGLRRTARTWTFELRKGVKFHNGRPLTAGDVKFSLDRILDPKTAARGQVVRSSIIESVQVVDPQTVRVHLTRASGAFLSRIAGTYQAILPPEAVQGPAFKPIGTGPFQLTEWKTNERVELKRFDGYWEAGLPYLDAVTLKPVPDGTVRLTALKTGDAGFVQLIPLESLAELQAAPSKDYVVTTVKGGGGFSAIILNSQEAAVQRRARAPRGRPRHGQEGSGPRRLARVRAADQQWMPPGTPLFFNVPDRKVDVEQAKKLLAEAGLAKGAKLTHTVGQTANLVPAAQVFQAQLTRIGIDLQLEVLDWPAYIKRQRAMDFTSTNTNFFPKVDPDDAYYRYFHSKGGANELSGGYANPAADKLLEEGEATVDAGKRAEAYRRLRRAARGRGAGGHHGPGRCGGRLADAGEGLRAAHHRPAGVSGGGLPNVWLER